MTTAAEAATNDPGFSGILRGPRVLVVEGWGLEVLAADPREYSSSLTAVMVPDGVDADKVRQIILERYDMSLGAGLGQLAGKVFRIGHLGDFNDLTLAGTLAGVQMGLRLAGVPASNGGMEQALARLQKFDD